MKIKQTLLDASYLLVAVFAASLAAMNVDADLVSAATTANVTATVTAQNVAVSVSDGSVAYGTLAISSTQDTTTGGVDDSQTVTNDGNVASDFDIQGQDSANWTLAATAGSETYTHKWCTTTCDSTPTWTAINNSSYTQVATGVAASGTTNLDLQIGTPTSTSNYTEQSVDVTVQVSAS